jgi:hypothetical protein
MADLQPRRRAHRGGRQDLSQRLPGHEHDQRRHGAACPIRTGGLRIANEPVTPGQQVRLGGGQLSRAQLA